LKRKLKRAHEKSDRLSEECEVIRKSSKQKVQLEVQNAKRRKLNSDLITAKFTSRQWQCMTDGGWSDFESSLAATLDRNLGLFLAGGSKCCSYTRPGMAIWAYTLTFHGAPVEDTDGFEVYAVQKNTNTGVLRKVRSRLVSNLAQQEAKLKVELLEAKAKAMKAEQEKAKEAARAKRAEEAAATAAQEKAAAVSRAQLAEQEKANEAARAKRAEEAAAIAAQETHAAKVEVDQKEQAKKRAEENAKLAEEEATRANKVTAGLVKTAGIDTSRKWQCKTDRGWQDFPEKETNIIELQHQEVLKTSGTNSCDLSFNGWRYKVAFKSDTGDFDGICAIQTNSLTKTERPVRRISTQHPDLSQQRMWKATPHKLKGALTYEIQKPSLVQASVVCLDNQHWSTALGHYKALGGANNLKRVVVLQNNMLNRQFDACREGFRCAGKSTDEIWVYHGTETTLHSKILEVGFKVGGVDDIPVRCGSAYGNGVYTAKGPGTPHNYGREVIILAKTLPGNFQQSPPPKACDEMDSWGCGSRDWVIFKSGKQLLPVYACFF
jgi:hypothetical protein